MQRFLIVNDDGVDSPMLPKMVLKLARLGEVSVVVPATEQSWKAKVLSRHGEVEVKPTHYSGAHQSFAVHGTPADCINLALNHLLDEPPDYVISGINIGHNAGLGLILNSGTVGAAIEAVMLNVPAFAFSVRIPPPMFLNWMRTRSMEGEQADLIVESCTTKMADMVEAFLPSYPNSTQPRALFNINFPGAVSPSTRCQSAQLDANRYGSVFQKKSDGIFEHRLQFSTVSEGLECSDVTALEQGHISITSINLGGLSANFSIPTSLVSS